MNIDLINAKFKYRISKLELEIEEAQSNQLSSEFINRFILSHVNYALVLIQNRKTKKGIEVLKEITIRFPEALKNKPDKPFLTDNVDFGNMLPGVE